ncbi:MAG: TonB-dependent receptor family protein, partial [Ekhidna sp.]
MNKLILILTSCVCSLWVNAQTQDATISTSRLKEVTISAPRLPLNAESLPLSITRIDSTWINASNQNLSIQEYLQQVPGVYVQNANNFAQDARISIRGFGATASFGIRGIKMIVDGIPETTPDGTGQLDNLNLDLIKSMEIIRGGASSIYGNASGGAIVVHSDFGFNKNYIQSNTSIGSYGFYSQSLTGGIKNKKTTASGNVRLFGNDGFRDRSAFKQTNARLAVQHQFSKRLKAVLLAEYVNSPKAEDAGGLTLEETATDFRQARDRNITFDAGESISQGKVGVSLKWDWAPNKQLNTYAFFNQRSFDGKLPFQSGGIIDLDRNYFGVGNSLDWKVKKHSFKIGYDLLSQKDSRSRFNNLEGSQGNVTLDQKESFINLGTFLLDYIEFDEWYLSGGLRFDLNQLKTKDRLLSDGDDSGDIDMNNLSYHIGVGRSLFGSAEVFIHHSTNFETPTLNQLSNRPDNSGGFEKLNASTASTFELGFRRDKNKFYTELVGFIIQTKDDLVSYELEAFPERTFYQNAGSTLRKGIEFSANYVTSFWRVNSSYTLSDFTYDSFEDDGDVLDGFTLPGIPKHHASLSFTANPTQSLEITLPINYVGEIQANNQNEVTIDSYLLLSFTARYKARIKGIQLEPYFGIRNLT